MRILATLVVLLLAGCAAVSEPAAAPTPLQREISGLARTMEETHPDLFHDVSRARFRAVAAKLAADAPGLSRPQLVARLMALVALPGPRDGHTAIYPFDVHPRALRIYPIRLYDFADGLHAVEVVGRPDLTGKRLTSIAGRPVRRGRPARPPARAARQRVEPALAPARVPDDRRGPARARDRDDGCGRVRLRGWRRGHARAATGARGRLLGRQRARGSPRARQPDLAAQPLRGPVADDDLVGPRRLPRLPRDDGRHVRDRGAPAAAGAGGRRSGGSSSTSASTTAATTGRTGRSSTRSRGP